MGSTGLPPASAFPRCAQLGFLGLAAMAQGSGEHGAPVPLGAERSWGLAVPSQRWHPQAPTWAPEVFLAASEHFGVEQGGTGGGNWHPGLPCSS